MDNQRNVVQFPAEVGGIFSFPKHSDWQWGSSSLLYSWVLEPLSTGVKQLEHEADHSLPSNARVKNESSEYIYIYIYISYTHTQHQYTENYLATFLRNWLIFSLYLRSHMHHCMTFQHEHFPTCIRSGKNLRYLMMSTNTNLKELPCF